MINHARTLLLNQATPKPEEIAEELIPRDFAPVPLTGPLLEVRRRLFGGTPDRAMLNYRLREIMTLLHNMDIEQFLLDLDPRYTYAVGEDDELVDLNLFEPQLTVPVQVSPAVVPSIQGRIARPDESGIMRWRFDYTQDILPTSPAVRQLSPVPITTTAVVLAATSPQLTDAIPLGKSGLSLRFTFQGSLVFPGPLKIEVNVLSRPQRSVADLEAALKSIGGENILELFGVGTLVARSEPFKTFFNLWTRHPEQPYRVAGILLAAIYQTERIRNAQ